MKKLPNNREVVEVKDAGLISLLGKKVSIMSVVYHYAGTLVGVNDTCIELENAGIVFETGDFSNKKYTDYQKLPAKSIFVQTGTIEAFFETDRI